MNKILIKIENKKIIFSKYNKEINEKDLNKTNIIDIKNLKFSEDYILKNELIVSSYIKLICLKNNINEVKIKTNDIALLVLLIIKNIKCINSIIFDEDVILSYLICDNLYNNKNIININCFNLPEVLFYRFNNRTIHTRAQILFKSDFMLENSINTYYDLCMKKKVVIYDFLSQEDYEDVNYFFSVNKECKKIFFKHYDRNMLLSILNIIKNKKNIIFYVYENKNNEKNIKADISFFSNIMKKYHIKIKIISNKNKKHLYILTITKLIFLLIIISIIFLLLTKK